MLQLAWIQSITSIQTTQILQVFLAAFLAQGRSTTEKLSAYFDKSIRPRLETSPLIVVAYNEEKNIVGFAIFEKWEGMNYYLAEMAVSPAYHRQGIGKQLVFSILSKEPSAEKILLITEEANRWSQAFYEKIGFKRSSFKHPQYSENFIGYEFCN